ncbi:MAG: hypothetical protein ACXWKP_08060 [Bradyrhizobium sp.]
MRKKLAVTGNLRIILRAGGSLHAPLFSQTTEGSIARKQGKHFGAIEAGCRRATSCAAAGEGGRLKYRHTSRADCGKQKCSLSFTLQMRRNPNVHREENCSDEHKWKNVNLASRRLPERCGNLIGVRGQVCLSQLK